MEVRAFFSYTDLSSRKYDIKDWVCLDMFAITSMSFVTAALLVAPDAPIPWISENTTFRCASNGATEHWLETWRGPLAGCLGAIGAMKGTRIVTGAC